MNSTNTKDRILIVEKSPGMDYRQAICQYVRKACRIVADHIEDYVPDKVYTEYPGEIVVRLPLDGFATIEVNTNTVLLKD